MAASILLFLDGSQPKVFTPSHHLSGKKRATESIYDSLLLEIGYSESYFTHMANGIMDRRNVATHPADVKVLDTMVDTAGEMIDAYPKTRQSVREEIIRIDHYSTIKKYFPCMKLAIELAQMQTLNSCFI